MAQVRTEAVARQKPFSVEHAFFERTRRKLEMTFTPMKRLGLLNYKWQLIDALGSRKGTVSKGVLTRFYDFKFGAYTVGEDRTRLGENVLEENPQLRRLDFVAEKLFENGTFNLLGVRTEFKTTGGPKNRIRSFEGVTAKIRIESKDRQATGVLTLDLTGDEIKFTKLEIVAGREEEFWHQEAYLARLSIPAGGIVIERFDSAIELAEYKRGRETSVALNVEDEPRKNWSYSTIRGVTETLFRKIYRANAARELEF